MPFEWSRFNKIFKHENIDLIKECQDKIKKNLSNKYGIDIDVAFKQFRLHVGEFEREYRIRNSNLIKDQNKNELNRMWDLYISGMFRMKCFINSVEEFRSRLNLLKLHFFIKTPFLKCTSSRSEAYEEWIADKDIPTKENMFVSRSEEERNLKLTRKELENTRVCNYVLEEYYDDCNEKLNNMVKPSAEVAE